MDRLDGVASPEEPSAARPALLHLTALAVYAVFFCAVLVPKLLPIRPGRIMSSDPADGSILLWSIGWWAHVFGGGHLVPYTHALFAPTGTNLAWTTSAPAAGIPFSPLTHAFGAFAVFNTLSVLAPITAAWTTYLLIRRITGRFGPSFLGGFLFGLSPLELDQVAVGHLNLSLTALVPLAAYLVVRSVEGSIRPLVFVVLFALVAAAQLGISTEIFATATAFGAMVLTLVFALDPGTRPAVRRTAGRLGLGYLGAGAIASPLLYAAFALPHPGGLASGHRAPFSGVETHVRFGSGAAVVALGLGLPLVAILVALALDRKRWPPVVRASAITALAALVCSAGIVVVGSTTIPTPWTLLRTLPFAGLVRPQRLTMFAWLIAAIGIGAWVAARPRSRTRWIVGGLVGAALLPPLWLGRWTSLIPPTPFSGGARSVVASQENLAVVAGSRPRSRQFADLASPMVWQVEAGFGFRLANAYVGSFGPSLPDAVRRWTFDRPLGAAQARSVRAWLERQGVGAVLIVRPSAASVARVRRVLGTTLTPLRGAVLLPVPR